MRIFKKHRKFNCKGRLTPAFTFFIYKYMQNIYPYNKTYKKDILSIKFGYRVDIYNIYFLKKVAKKYKKIKIYKKNISVIRQTNPCLFTLIF